jgi:predicted RNA-binding Zn-ribbon protein involved in translation (DUF1610 family)
MDATPLSSPPALTCTQCGGELHPDEGQIFLTCPYCAATVYLDKSRVVFHWYVAPTLSAEQARSALFRWMSGSQTVKDLDKKSQVVGQDFRYFPLWYHIWSGGKDEQMTLQPAAATSITELAQIKLPAGDLRKYEAGLDAQSEAPSVPLEAAAAWLTQAHGKVDVRETALVHVPIYIFKYNYRGRVFTAIVDAANGTVLASLFPAKAEAPYLLVGGVAALIYLCLALIPVFGALSGGEDGVLTGMLLCSGLGAVAAPVLLAWAVWVASKV